jgi:hypothetical protein
VPMIDVYAGVGTFRDPHALALKLAETLMTIEEVPNIPMFRVNTAASVHELSPSSISNVDGEGNYVRVQVLTNSGALDRPKQLAVVTEFADLIAEAGEDETLKERTWILLTEAIPGGWGLWGHAHTNDEFVDAARAEIARLSDT